MDKKQPSWVPCTHHQVPQPAGSLCADYYEARNPDACELLYALAHTKAEADRLREALAWALETAQPLRAPLGDQMKEPDDVWPQWVIKARAALAYKSPEQT